MGRSKNYGKIYKNITILSAGSEGNCVARLDEGKVIFVKHAAPGDVADLKIVGRKKKFLIAEIDKLHTPSKDRVEPFCDHFGICGGCKWQHLSYEAQLEFKTQQVRDAFDRIGKLKYPEIPPILASHNTTFYRNKLEFTFSDNRWLEKAQIESEEFRKEPGLGFHIPQRFDKIVHVNKCWLQDDLSNQIRNFVLDWSVDHNLSFYNARSQEGLLRNLMLRNTRAGDWMFLITFLERDERIPELLNAVQVRFPQIKSLVFSINGKVNDSIYDLDIEKFSGDDYLTENLNDLNFRIRPKSFFQTNPNQAETLYNKALSMAGLSGNECVYDLYCGTGTISLLAAKKAKKVVGIESVPQAVNDARENAKNNDVVNAEFVVGDMKDVFQDAFFEAHGNPDVIITDPPRAGMHPSVIAHLIKSKVPAIIYVSCNPATQARDLQLLEEAYSIKAVQPVDMFPHTHHVENVVRLERRTGV